MGLLLRRSGADGAVSDIMGTMLTVAVVATLVGVIALQAVSTPDARADGPLPLDVGAFGQAGSDQIVFVHEGGSPFAADAVHVVVAMGGAIVHEAPLGPAGEIWNPGDTRWIQLPSAPAPGVPVDVTFRVADESGARATSAPVHVGSLRSTPENTGIAASWVDPELRGGPLETVALRADISHAHGRKLIDRVEARLGGVPTEPVQLADDGTRGDGIAHDGVYGGFLQLPLDLPNGTYPITLTATDLYGGVVSTTILLHVGHTTPPPRGPPFTILPPGGIVPGCSGPVVMEIIGVDITMGKDGPRIPVMAHWTKDEGATFAPFAGGLPVARGMQESFVADPSNVLGVRGTASGFGFFSTYTSFQGDPHVVVLKDGDTPPDKPAYGPQQQDLEEYLKPYVKDGKISLAREEAIVLFEFVKNLQSEAADFQDLVVLYDFPTC